MNHCKTCKHWVPFEQTKDFVADREWDAMDLAELLETNALHAHTLIRVKHLGLCKKADGIAPVDPDSLAYAEDGSDYRANFRTAADFGCVMHEAKP